MTDAIHQRAMLGVTTLGVDPDDVEGLYRLLGARMKMLERDPSIAGNFAPAMVAPTELGFSVPDLLNFGRDAFLRIGALGQPLICGTEANQGFYLQRILSTLNTNPAAVTAAISTLLVAHLAIAPVIAGVVATIIVGKVAPTSLAALCQTWSAKLTPASPTIPPAGQTTSPPGQTTPPMQPPAEPPGNPPAPPADQTTPPTAQTTPPATPPAEPPGNPPAPPTPPDEPSGNPPPPSGGPPGNPPTT
jgi:hypothetical protein